MRVAAEIRRHERADHTVFARHGDLDAHLVIGRKLNPSLSLKR
jgi:hypothetical protein